MKMRKKLAALLAAAIIASAMPMTAFAASDNRVTKDNVNVEKDQSLTTTHAVELVITMKKNDEFKTDDVFYLELEDAEWSGFKTIAEAFGVGGMTDDDDEMTVKLDKAGAKDAIIRRENDKRLAVVAVDDFDEDDQIRIPIRAKVTGDEPTVKVDPFGSSIVSASKHAIAVATTGKAIVTVGSVPTIAGTDKMASITFEEPFVGAFNKGKDGKNRTIEVELRDTDFSFNDRAGLKLKGTRAFSGKVDIAIDTAKSSAEKLVFVIDDADNATIAAITNRGGFVLEDVKVKPNKDAREGDVKVTLDGNLVDKKQVVVAKYGDFTTTLKMAKDNYSVVAGKELEVEFTLAEEMADALIGNRTVNFAFSKDIVIGKDIEVVKTTNADDAKFKAAGNITIKTIERVTGDPINTNEFTVDNFYNVSGKKASYKLKATLLVPAGYTGDIMLTAEGRGLEEKKEVLVAKTEAPVTVEAKASTIKVGLKKQETDAKIVIKETKEDRLAKGKDIIVEIADKDTGLKFISADIKVTEGDLELVHKDDFEVKDGKISFEVKRHSTEPSTIEITNIVVGADRSVPQGSYDIKVGGSAISDFTKNIHFGDKKSTHTASPKVLNGEVLDKVATIKDFIVVGTPNTEDIAGGVNKAKVSFTVGANQYLVNAQEATMDATPYIKDGRTMVPVRYVATALGIKDDQVVWDQANQTATILADKTVQVKLGSKDMVVNGVVITMSAAAELKADRTFVPVAEIARALGVPVEWDAATQTATFN